MKIVLLSVALLFMHALHAQELFVYSEPASNMSKGNIGVRLTEQFLKMSHGTDWRQRTIPEVMLGISPKLMFHAAAYASNAYTGKYKMEGGSVYLKWRFLSNDDVHKHFRVAAFGKLSFIDNPNVYRTENSNYLESRDIDLDGNNTGAQAGFIATKLVNKLALSGSVSFIRAVKNLNANKSIEIDPNTAVNYSASIGYLLLPREYTSYRQTNLNIYLEYTGQSTRGGYQYGNLHPALQLIFNSVARLDLGASLQIHNSGERMSNSGALVRFEYNFLNALSHKKRK